MRGDFTRFRADLAFDRSKPIDSSADLMTSGEEVWDGMVFYHRCQG